MIFLLVYVWLTFTSVACETKKAERRKYNRYPENNESTEDEVINICDLQKYRDRSSTTPSSATCILTSSSKLRIERYRLLFVIGRCWNKLAKQPEEHDLSRFSKNNEKLKLAQCGK